MPAVESRADAVEQARLLRRQAEVGYRLGAFGAARRVLLRALTLLEPVKSAPATAQRAAVAAWLGVVLLGSGRPATALPWLELALADGEAVIAKEAVARALAGLDVAYRDLGESHRASHARRALAIYDELGDLVSKGGVLNNLGTIAYYTGRWDDAVDLYRAALEAWERAGDSQSVSLAAFNIGEILSAQGRLDEAEPLIRDSERASRAAGGATDIAMSIMETAMLEARRGKVAVALDQLEEARRAFVAAGDRVDDTPRRGAHRRGAPARRASQSGQASSRASRSAAPSDEDGGALVLPTLHRVLGQAHLLSGRLEEARRVARARAGRGRARGSPL